MAALFMAMSVAIYFFLAFILAAASFRAFWSAACLALWALSSSVTTLSVPGNSKNKLKVICTQH